MADTKRQPLKKLGKLSVAILEHHVDKVIGEDTIDILKADYKENEALVASLANAQQRFRDDFDDDEMYRVFFEDLSIKNLPSLNAAYRAFYARPTSPDLPRALQESLVPYIRDEHQERLNQAIAEYILFLREELAQVDETFRDNVHAIAGIRSEQLLEGILSELQKQSGSSLSKESFSQNEENTRVQVLIEGIDESKFDDLRQQALITTVAALTSISPEQVKILSVQSGSLIVILLMPHFAAEILVQLVQKRDEHLKSMNVSEAKIIGVNDQPLSSDQSITPQPQRTLGAIATDEEQPEKLENINEIPGPGALPQGSRMVFLRNKIFTGRKKDLKALARSVFGDQTPTLVTQTITGIGGIGKTQLAVEFCYRYGRHFRGVHWIDAAAIPVEEGKQPIPLLSKIGAEIAQCGAAMLLPDWPQEQPEQVKRTLEHWSQTGPRLVVLDNLEEVRAAQEIMELLSRGGDVRILITARRQEWPKALVGKPYRLGVFTKTESREFLREYLFDRQVYSQKQLDELAEHLGYLPLALELAGRYLRRIRQDIPAYVESLEEIMGHPSMDNWKPEDVVSATEHDLSLRATFLVSWEAVSDKTAQWVFCLLSWCAANEPVPRQLLLDAAIVNEEQLSEALMLLEDVGLITYPKGALDPVFHPLVGEFGRAESRASAGLADIGQVAKTMMKLAVTTLEHGLPNELKKISTHLEVIAGHAESATLSMAGSLWNSQGSYFQKIADFKGAQAVLERALDLAEAAYGAEHPNVANSVNNLGTVLKELGDLQGAKAMLERALAIDEAAYGPEHPEVATDVNNLGTVLKDLGDLQGAKAMYERALAILEKQLGEDHPYVAATVNNLGTVLKDLGDLQGAKAMYERALAIAEAAYGPEHPSVATNVNNLGNLLRELGDLQRAKFMLERALAIFEIQLGKDHPNVATTVNNLGTVLQELGNLRGAQAMYERALDIDEAAYGPEHPEVATDVNNLGTVLKELGDLQGAKVMLERALTIFKKLLPANHPNIQTIKENIKSLGDS
ncbi:MAG: tetratricopeptide repeat protein [Chloroflexi bacterium]|nr:MAG: tetratricopeptide repeat protein [Chloroflexota bacterium]MBL1195222.1 tetratricopeptide repeat protein [Chloroflexota bacterium]NOH12507.1 tetratricopeptide repeat protein [Chloroflexota bacterium]